MVCLLSLCVNMFAIHIHVDFVHFVEQGMTHSVLYTTIPDLRVRLRTGAEYLSYALAFGMIGPMIGGPSAAVVDRWAIRGVCTLCNGLNDL